MCIFFTKPISLYNTIACGICSSWNFKPVCMLFKPDQNSVMTVNVYLGLLGFTLVHWFSMCSLGPILVHLVILGFTWDPLGSLGFNWVHLVLHSFTWLTSVPLGSFGFTWVPFDLTGVFCVHLGSFWFLSTKFCSLCFTRAHMGSVWFTWVVVVYIWILWSITFGQTFCDRQTILNLFYSFPVKLTQLEVISF